MHYGTRCTHFHIGQRMIISEFAQGCGSQSVSRRNLSWILIPLTRGFNPYAAGGSFGQHKMMQKTLKMTETLAHGYSYDRTP